MDYSLMSDDELERVAYASGDPLAMELARRLVEHECDDSDEDF